jgi:hypothetical protein
MGVADDAAPAATPRDTPAAERSAPAGFLTPAIPGTTSTGTAVPLFDDFPGSEAQPPTASATEDVAARAAPARRGPDRLAGLAGLARLRRRLFTTQRAVGCCALPRSSRSSPSARRAHAPLRRIAVSRRPSTRAPNPQPLTPVRVPAAASAAPRGTRVNAALQLAAWWSYVASSPTRWRLPAIPRPRAV